MAGQMGSLMRTPDLPGPKYTILRKTKQYEIRRCACAMPQLCMHAGCCL